MRIERAPLRLRRSRGIGRAANVKARRTGGYAARAGKRARRARQATGLFAPHGATAPAGKLPIPAPTAAASASCVEHLYIFKGAHFYAVE